MLPSSVFPRISVPRSIISVFDSARNRSFTPDHRSGVNCYSLNSAYMDVAFSNYLADTIGLSISRGFPGIAG